MSRRATAWLCLASLWWICGCSAEERDAFRRTGLLLQRRAHELAAALENAGGLSLASARDRVAVMELAGKVQARVQWDSHLAGAAIRVSAQAGTVTLRGRVLDVQQRQRALHLASTTAGVREVRDELHIAGSE